MWRISGRIKSAGLQSAIVLYQFCPSVCLSVQCRYCFETIAHIIKKFPASVRGITLVFWSSPPSKITKGTPSSEHVSAACAERKTERSGQKIGWTGAERWADIPENAWAGAERGAGGRGAGAEQSGAESELNRPLVIRSHQTSKIIDLC